MSDPKKHQISVYSLLSGPSSNDQPQPPRAQYPAVFDPPPTEQTMKPQTFYDPIKDVISHSPQNVSSQISIHSVLNKEPTPRSNKMSLSAMMNDDSSNNTTPPVRNRLVINDLLQPSDDTSSNNSSNQQTNEQTKRKSSVTSNNSDSKDGNEQHSTKKRRSNKRKNDSPSQSKIHRGEPMITLPKPAFLDVVDSSSKAKPTDKRFEPIIALHIPLVPPGTKPDQSQAIFNVMKLCEDKYGFNVMHPNGRIAFDLDEFEDDKLMDDDIPQAAAAAAVAAVAAAATAITNDDDTSTGGDDLKEDVLKKLKMKFKPGMTDDEKEDMILKELHRRNMENNKRIGKYDIHDPFIDDEELLFEEQTKTNKDGFFVYYGPIVDESSNVTSNDPKKRSDPATTKKRKGNSSKMTKQPPKELVNDDGVLLTVSGRPRKKPGPRSKKEKEMMALEQHQGSMVPQSVKPIQLVKPTVNKPVISATESQPQVDSTTTQVSQVGSSNITSTEVPSTVSNEMTTIPNTNKTQAETGNPLIEVTKSSSASAGGNGKKKPMDNQIIIGDFPF